MPFFSTKKIVTPLSFILLSLGMMNSAQSRGQACIDGSTPPEDGCFKAAEKYELTIFEMGLCTADPLILNSGNRVFNKSEASCVATFANNKGKLANIAGSKSVNLGNGPIPPSKTYTHAYIVLDKNITIKGRHKLGDITHYSIEHSDEFGTIGFSSTNPSSHEQFTESVDNVSSSEIWGSYMPAQNHPDGGSVTALLIGSGYSANDNSANAASSKSAVKKLIGVFTPSGGGVIIDKDVKGLTITLDSSQGMNLELSSIL